MSKAQVKLNAEIASFIERKDAKQESYTLDDINYIQQYTGAGGLKIGGRGSLYEYYTPDSIIKKMWGLVYDNGFNAGHILEPSVGTGRFLRYVDFSTSSADAFEFSKDDTTSFRVAKISFPNVNFTNDYFESIFYEGNMRKGTNKKYDLVIGNPPYGDFTGKYSGKAREGKFFKGQTYDQYFIWAGLELLNSGGLLCFIIPSSFLDNGSSYENIKDEFAAKADLIDAYRLPRSVFDFTQIQTDIVLFRKK